MQKSTLCLIFAWYAGLLAGQSVVLDTTFGAGGFVYIDLKDRNLNPYGDNMVALPNGALAIVGDLWWDSLFVEKYADYGIKEAAFTTHFTDFSQYQVGASIQKDGKIIVSGYKTLPPFHTAIARMNVDGGIDTTFGMGGTASVFLDHIYVSNLFELSNGKIISYGCENLNNGNPPTVITRLNTDGSIDSTFGINGTFRRDIISGYEFIPTGLEQPDGKLLFVGMASWTILMLRLNPDGQIDSTFGQFGIMLDPIGGRDVACEAYDLLLLQDGKITVTGYTRNPRAAVVIRYNADGTHDTNFGFQGIQYFSGSTEGVSIVGRSDDKVIVALTGPDTLGFITELAQLLPNGERDSSFGVNGIFRLPEPKLRARALMLADNKLTLSCRNEDSKQITLVRLVLDLSVGILDPKVQSEATTCIFPNPVSEQFTLKFELTQKEQVSIQLFDLNGKLAQSFVQNHSFDQGEQELTLSCANHLAAGNYILTLEVAGKKMRSIQIIKK